MTTANSGAGASFIAVPPKRLKPKSQHCDRSSPKSRLPQPAFQSSPIKSPSIILPPNDPAQAIEQLLISRHRRTHTLFGIGEDKWSENFPFDDHNNHFGGNLYRTDTTSSFGLQVTKASPHLSPRDRRESSGSNSSTASTLCRSIEESRPLLSFAPCKHSSKKFHRPRPTSHPSSSPPQLPSLSTSTTLSSLSGFVASVGLSVGSIGSSVTRSCLNRDGEQKMMNSMSDNNNFAMGPRDLCIAVIGAAGVGKSTFIQRAFDLQVPPSKSEVPSISIVVDRTRMNLKLIEIDWTNIDFEQQPPQWPRIQASEGQSLPFIDGVLVLYDVTNPMSIVKVPETLDAFSKALLPVCLVSTKCDASERQLNPNNIEQVGTVGGYEQIQTSLTARDSQKECIVAILSMISRKNEKNPRYLNGRRRANSSAANSRATSPRPSTAGHNRASSEISTSLYKKDDPNYPYAGRISRSPASPALGTLALDSISGNSTPASASFPLDSGPSKLGLTPTPFLEVVNTSPFSMKQSTGASSQSSSQRQSYVDTDDDDSLIFRDPDDIPILEREDDVDELDEGERQQVPNRGWTWDELVDKLLSQQMSRMDAAFATSLLCFYRKFAAPKELLAEIIERFDRVEREEKVSLQRIATQFRYCNVLHQWVSSHPGDCANLRTRSKLFQFLERISSNRSLAFLAKEMLKVLALEIEDEDETWSRNDSDGIDRQNNQHDFITEFENPDNPSSQRPRPTDSLYNGKRMSENSQDSSGQSSTSTVKLDPNAPHPQAKLILNATSQWEVFMSIPVDEIAGELTRIDWAEYAKFKPRDLVRHISIPSAAKETTPSLAHINKMIRHFNHVAYWVASVILEKQKAKHRAKALEKFMEIAWCLRHKNNYNGLGAVIAGINGTAIHRLSQTREIVRPEVHKNFMRLELLMGTHKSHSKYRLAWENTTTARIPFLPLHRRDLVSADEGNKTFLNGDKINWSKFQVMGEVLSTLTRSQTIPYQNLKGNQIVENLIHDAVLTMDEDELYERSVQLENAANSNTNRSKRNWFQR